jgi:prolyl oligopeptidase PreP (S9A serine peptidase family)
MEANSTATYRHDLATGETTLWRKPRVRFDPDDYEVKQVFYRSKDGTRVPMLVALKKGIKLDGGNPAHAQKIAKTAAPGGRSRTVCGLPPCPTSTRGIP